jgi:hypothetical protein
MRATEHVADVLRSMRGIGQFEEMLHEGCGLFRRQAKLCPVTVSNPGRRFYRNGSHIGTIAFLFEGRFNFTIGVMLS